MAILIPTKVLQKHANPFRNSPWGVRVSRKAVMAALREDRLEPSPGTQHHVERIAYLVRHFTADPIEIDVGVPTLGCYVHWIIQDGNHRFAAALFRKDMFISANVSGSLVLAEELFGIDCEGYTFISEEVYRPE